MKRVNKLLLVLLAVLIASGSHRAAAQSVEEGMLALDGLVYGYNYDYSKKLLKKERQIKVEGVLENVTVAVADDKGKIIKTVKTNSHGLFYVKIRTGKIYSVQFSKEGYSGILMNIDLTAVPEELQKKGMSFVGAELLLNSFQSKTKPAADLSMGRLYYNTGKSRLDFEENKNVPKKQKEYIGNSVSLMLRSVEKNAVKSTSVPDQDDVIREKAGTKPLPTITVSENEPLPVGSASNTGIRKTNDTISKILGRIREKAAANGPVSTADIEELEAQVRRIRDEFENEKRMGGDSLDLLEKEQLLSGVEAQLATAKRIIDLQDSQISGQRIMLGLAVGCVLLLSVLSFMFFRFNREKKRTNILLEDKNKKITDSINYASRIQNAALPSGEEVHKQLPDSFIYFQPKDVVSGDFYWISTVNEKTLVACVDCTGHGVPGAFMSLIGNTLLNQIVQEKQITDPSQVLKHLHYGIVKALQQNTSHSDVKDGMDMSLCVIDKRNGTVSYAGAMNPVYVVNDNTVTVVKPDIRSIGGMKEMDERFEFTQQSIKIVKGTSIYMFTDGYMDQFGGPENKKFNIPNFKKMILDIQPDSMALQGKKVEERMNSWKGNAKQIDDMLVIGIRL